MQENARKKEKILVKGQAEPPTKAKLRHCRRLVYLPIGLICGALIQVNVIGFLVGKCKKLQSIW